MNIYLITGVAGFIGSHLAESLLQDGHRVYGIDNFCTGSRTNVELLKAETNFHFLEMSLIDSDASARLNEFLKNTALDGVFHLACPASPKDFIPLGVDILEVCSIGVKHVLGIALAKMCPFLLASTSEVYGDPAISPQVESYLGNVSCMGIRSCYDEGKRFAESYTINYGRKHYVDYRIARIFNTYGPRMREDDGRVLPNFFSQIKSGKPLTIYGDGLQTRSLCHVTDIVKGLIQMMNKENYGDVTEHPLKTQRIMNLGNPEEVSILNIAHALENILGRDLGRDYLPLPESDPLHRKPDITLAQTHLGFTPTISLHDGLKVTLQTSGLL